MIAHAWQHGYMNVDANGGVYFRQLLSCLSEPYATALRNAPIALREFQWPDSLYLRSMKHAPNLTMSIPSGQVHHLFVCFITAPPNG